VKLDDTEYQVNLIEYLPYNIKITLDTFVDFDYMSYYSEYNDISYSINKTHQDMEYVEYYLEVNNNNKSVLTDSFLEPNNIYLELEDSTKIYLDNALSVFAQEDVESKGSTNMVFHFNINIDKQDEIQTLNFGSVSVGGNTSKVVIEL